VGLGAWSRLAALHRDHHPDERRVSDDGDSLILASRATCLTRGPA